MSRAPFVVVFRSARFGANDFREAFDLAQILMVRVMDPREGERCEIVPDDRTIPRLCWTYTVAWIRDGAVVMAS